MKFICQRFLLCSLLIMTVLSAKAASTNKAAVIAPPLYPRTIETTGGKVEIHMPQVEGWEKYQDLTAWVVVEVILNGNDKRWIGSVKINAKTDINFDERFVVVHDIDVIDRKFHDGITPPTSVLDIARAAISLKPKTLPLDVLLRALPEDFVVTKKQPATSVTLHHEPPKIFVATKPSALMIINGEVVKAPIENTQLEFVVNTNWDLVYDNHSEFFYVLNEGTWQQSRSLAPPQWTTTTSLPADFGKLPDNKNWASAKQHIPIPPVKDTAAKAHPADIIVSFEPAEMILIDDKPQFMMIADTGIEWLTNTTSDVFRYQQAYYYLVAGRWFKTKQLFPGNSKEQWQFVQQLPAEFAKIPENHQKGHVLAAVPGTVAARVAMIEASIPRQAKINTNAGAGITVTYDGEPKFVAIENTNMQRAANTQYQVILVNGSYFLCHNAVWFSSDAAHGPWKVASAVPDVVYTIPASDPAYNTTYVYVEPTSTNTVTTHVTYAYTSGYYGYYPYGSTIVYGSGWYYPPYYYYAPWGYPAYWAYPTSYGYGSWYNPSTGRYGERAVAYGPYGGTAASSVYNPRTGSYARGSSVWDSDEVARSGYAYNPNTRAYAAGNMYYDFDDNKGWREGYVERGNRWVYAETELDKNSARTEYETAKGIEGTSNRTRNDDNVTGSGTISYKDRSATTTSQVDKDGAQIDIKGEQGGTATLSKQQGQAGSTGQITTSDGRTADIDSKLTEQGRKTEIEGASGGKASSVVNESGRVTAGKSQSGDLYAGKNGSVYKKNAEGSWSHYQDGDWKTVSGTERDRSTNKSKSKYGDSSNLTRQYNARKQGSRNFSQFQNRRRGMGRSRGRRR